MTLNDEAGGAVKPPKILLLGGYGRVGIETVRYLLKHTEADIRLAARSLRSAPADIEQAYRPRLSETVLDATDEAELQQACREADLVIACIGPAGLVGDRVAQACKQVGTPLVDAGGYDPVLKSLDEAEADTPTQVPLVINVGLLPGLSGLFPQHVIAATAAGRDIEQLDIQYVGRDAWSYNSAWDIIHGLGDFGEERGFCYLEQGSTVRVPMFRAGHKAQFPQPIGKVSTMLIYAEEIARLAQQHGVKTARVFGANIGPRAMFVGMIAKLFGLYKTEKQIDRAAKWLVKASEKDMRSLQPAYAIQVDVTYASGLVASGQWVLTDTYQATGVTLGITARAVLDGDIGKPGVYLLHEAIDDGLFMRRFAQAGLSSVQHIQSGEQELIEGVQV